MIDDKVIDTLRGCLLNVASSDANTFLGVCEDLIEAKVRERPAQAAQVETLLSMPGVAKRLGIPETRAYELARQGRLKTIKVGKYVRVRPEDLATFVKESEVR